MITINGLEVIRVGPETSTFLLWRLHVAGEEDVIPDKLATCLD